LSDAVTTAELDLLVAVVDQQDADLPAIARVDEPGPIDDTNTKTLGVARSGQDEACVTLGNGNCDAGGDRGALTRDEEDVDSGVKIYGGIADMCTTRGR
jgi:hypothetical protein